MSLQVCLVMELAKGGELFDKLLEEGCLSEREAVRIISQVRRDDVKSGIFTWYLHRSLRQFTTSILGE